MSFALIVRSATSLKMLEKLLSKGIETSDDALKLVNERFDLVPKLRERLKLAQNANLDSYKL